MELNTMEKNGASVGKVFDECAKKNPNKPAIMFKDEVWTFKQVWKLQPLYNTVITPLAA